MTNTTIGEMNRYQESHEHFGRVAIRMVTTTSKQVAIPIEPIFVCLSVCLFVSL